MYTPGAKLHEEIYRLNADLKERDAYIESRKAEIATLDSLIFQSREGFNSHKAQRDKLQDERKYGYFSVFILVRLTESTQVDLFCLFL